jgi:hypothetical protein
MNVFFWLGIRSHSLFQTTMTSAGAGCLAGAVIQALRYSCEDAHRPRTKNVLP